MTDYYAIIAVAFFGSFGHCIGMCGGLVLAYTQSKIPQNSSFFFKIFSHIFYNFGRIISYMILGAMCGFVGFQFDISSKIAGYFHFFVGILIILIGLNFLGKIRFLQFFEIKFTFFPLIKVLLNSNSKLSFFALGILNGLLPCGLVYFFLASAALSQSAIKGAFIMLIFGLSTLLAMLGFGLAIGWLKDLRFQNFMRKLSSFMIVFYGLKMSFYGFLTTQA